MYNTRTGVEQDLVSGKMRRTYRRSALSNHRQTNALSQRIRTPLLTSYSLAAIATLHRGSLPIFIVARLHDG